MLPRSQESRCGGEPKFDSVMIGERKILTVLRTSESLDFQGKIYDVQEKCRTMFNQSFGVDEISASMTR